MKDSAFDYLVDAGPLVAYLNKSDQWHVWANAAMRYLGETVITTDAAFTEVCYLLRKQRTVMDELLRHAADGFIRVHSILPTHLARLHELMSKYDFMDLADATLVVLSEQYPKAKLITLDKKDFTIYRRHDGHPVPCIMPE